jgi:predicted AlkP superfamily pyrophosphatase or phosphodiesterase
VFESVTQRWAEFPVGQPTHDPTVMPDYAGGSIVNLMSTLVAACGGVPDWRYPPLKLLGAASAGLPQCRTIILMVIDGLGHDVLCQAAEGGALHQRLVGTMTSVFPSTTAAAITTFLTGAAPQQHGLTGWFTYLRELAGVFALLPGKPRCGGSSFGRAGIDPRLIFDAEPVFNRLPRRSIVITPRHISESDYNCAFRGRAEQRCYDGLDEFFLEMARAVRESPEGSQFIYAYWPDLDTIGHEYGIGSKEARRHLAQIDERFDRFCRTLAGSDAAVIVTADHGMIDSDEAFAVEVADHPALTDCLLLPLCGERRAAYCYLREGSSARFEAYVTSELAHAARCVRSSQWFDEGAYGVGQPHPRLRARIGDYVLLMKDRYVISDWLPGEAEYRHIGFHGGLSASEMLVPLVAAVL